MKNYLLLSVILAATFLACSTGCKRIARYPISEPSAANMEDRIIGRWKLEEDTNKNNFYEILKGYGPLKYHVKFWDRGGTNPTYESNLFFSRIGNATFINAPYWEDGFTNKGYFFLKILKVNESYDKITTAMVADTTMLALKNSAEVHDRIARNLDKPSYYHDTMHFYKMK